MFLHVYTLIVICHLSQKCILRNVSLGNLAMVGTLCSTLIATKMVSMSLGNIILLNQHICYPLLRKCHIQRAMVETVIRQAEITIGQEALNNMSGDGLLI